MIKIDKATVYNLGGNAAGIYTKGDNTTTYDYSAYDYSDTGSLKVKTNAKQVGFRVVQKLK